MRSKLFKKSEEMHPHIGFSGSGSSGRLEPDLVGATYARVTQIGHAGVPPGVRAATSDRAKEKKHA